jgi:hypothetical protein
LIKASGKLGATPEERDQLTRILREASREGQMEDLVRAINVKLDGSGFHVTLDWRHEGRTDVELRQNGAQVDEIQIQHSHRF